MDMPTLVAKMRLQYHANLLDVNNVLNQLGIISDSKAEQRNKNHTMTIITDILPRIYGKDTIEKIFDRKDEGWYKPFSFFLPI